MLTVQQADQIIRTHSRTLPAELRKISDSCGAVLREDVRLDRDQPPFDKALLDGIAVAFRSWRQGRRDFPVQGIAPAGQPALKLRSPDHCVQIMTGAVLPKGADTVIPVEQIILNGKTARVSAAAQIEKGQGVRPHGADGKKGETILRKGTRLLPVHIGAAASVGKDILRVTARPRIAVIATGDELVDIAKRPIRSYEIRKSNSFALEALFRQTGADVELFHFRDDAGQMTRGIRKILRNSDVLVLSGGVSMGKYDLVPGILQSLGVRTLFHKVLQKPGKPLWFGKTSQGKIVFGLPGNPVSTQICAYRYVLPFLRRMCGLRSTARSAVLTKPAAAPSTMTQFLPVRVTAADDGRWTVQLSRYHGSGDSAVLAQAHGFIELAPRKTPYKSSENVPFHLWSEPSYE